MLSLRYILLIIFSFFITFHTLHISADNNRFQINIQNNILSLNLALKEGEKIYWLHPGDMGDGTDISINNSINIENYYIMWPYPIQEESIPNTINYVYKGFLSIPIVVIPKIPNQLSNFIINIKYMLCTISQCIPVKQTLNPSYIIVSEKKQCANNFSISSISYNQKLSQLKLNATFPYLLDTDANFIIKPIGQVFVKDTIVTKNNRKNFDIIFNINYDIYKNFIGKKIEIYSDQSCIPQSFILPNEPSNKDNNMLSVILLAFLGGVILNFMPCVLPVLSLKIFSLIKHTKTYRRTSLIITLCGILTTFFALSLVSIFLKFYGHYFNLGLNFQQPSFVIVLSIIITIFISITLEQVYIPQISVNWLEHTNIKYIQDFITGIVITLLSTPCTAPFLGTALLVAITNSYINNIIIFSSIAFGFGSPYILLIIHPKLLNWIPKPGPWLLYMKKIFAGLLWITVAWLLSIIYNQLGINATIYLFLLLVLVKFIIEIKESWLAVLRYKLLSLTLLLFASLSLPYIAHNQDIRKHKYIDTIWKSFDYNLMREHINNGQTVIVTITADWCLACKVNKIMALERRNVLESLKRYNVIAMKGDFTKESEEIKKFLIENNVYGIPFTIVYTPKDPEGKVLPTLLSTDDIINAIE